MWAQGWLVNGAVRCSDPNSATPLASQGLGFQLDRIDQNPFASGVDGSPGCYGLACSHPT